MQNGGRRMNLMENTYVVVGWDHVEQVFYGSECLFGFLFLFGKVIYFSTRGVVIVVSIHIPQQRKSSQNKPQPVRKEMKVVSSKLCAFAAAL
jgi:hypothetical protein